MKRQSRHSRFDAPFWLAILAGVLALGAFGCFSLAAAADEVAPKATNVVVADDT